MKLNLSISNRLLLGFGVLTLVALVSLFSLSRSLVNNKKATITNTDIYTPSVTRLNALYEVVNESKHLIKNWVYIEKHAETEDKKRLIKIIDEEYGGLKNSLLAVSTYWDSQLQDQLGDIFIAVEDSLFTALVEVTQALSSFEDYNNLMVIFDVTPRVEGEGDIILLTSSLLTQISNLSNEI